MPSRWKVLSGEFRRRPTELAKEFSKPDRVGRRGLSEPREDFSRLPTNLCSIPWLESVAELVLGSVELGLVQPEAGLVLVQPEAGLVLVQPEAGLVLVQLNWF